MLSNQVDSLTRPIPPPSPNPQQPIITVIVPVYNRVDELHRALISLTKQTFHNFECIVIDDCSSLPIKEIVEQLKDPRFIYIKNSQNGGPYNARTCGYKTMKGQYLFHLDSDWEAFPWALNQAVHYLDQRPEIDGVAGLHLRDHDSSLFVRVKKGEKVVTPKLYVEMDKVPDCIGAVRKCVVEEWLKKRTDYFAFEFHQWFTFSLNHNQLYVDEPWCRYYMESGNRVTDQKIDHRRLDDCMKFITEHDKEIREINRPFLNDILFTSWFKLRRAGRIQDSKVVMNHLNQHNVSLLYYFAKKSINKMRAIFTRKKKLRKDVFYVG